MKSSLTPYQFILDFDGHWYLMPVEKIGRFDELMEIMENSDDFPSVSEQKELEKYVNYRVDNIESVNIYQWEEVT